MAGFNPFKGKTADEVLYKNYEGFVDVSGLNGCCDNNLVDLALEMLQNEPGIRKGADELLMKKIFTEDEIEEGSRLLSRKYRKYSQMYAYLLIIFFF